MNMQVLPEGFVALSQAVPEIAIDLKYTTSDNLIGRPLMGYAPDGVAVVTNECAQALAKILATLKTKDVCKALNVQQPNLLVWEAFRPLMAGDDFWAWSQSACEKTKKEYYPNVDKKDFFDLGYIARRSSHSRGSAVDVTIIDTIDGQWRYLDFGTRFDFMDELSHPDNPNVSKTAFNNRQFLKNLMSEFGFEGIDQEWWHFALRDEPFPDTYFNFPVMKYD